MILTGPKIEECLENGSIVIDPLGENLVGPNSVDLRLHAEMKVYADVSAMSVTPPWWDASKETGRPLDTKKEFPTKEICMPGKGYVLQPGILYLGRTMETIGSDIFVLMVAGRVSSGHLGLQIHTTIGDTGFKGTIGLEMTVVHPLRVYPAIPIAQVFFLHPEGKIRLYHGRYQGHKDPTASRMHEGRRGAGQ